MINAFQAFQGRKQKHVAPINKPTIKSEVKKGDVEFLTVGRETECHVTPTHVSRRMADYLGLSLGAKIAEPHAGTGQLIRALLDVGYTEITAVEKDLELFNHLDFYNKINHDFLVWSLGKINVFDGILMNSPYAKRGAYRHFEAAISILKEDGRIIALVPVNFLMDDVYDLEILPIGTFENTAIATKIVEYTKC